MASNLDLNTAPPRTLPANQRSARPTEGQAEYRAAALPPQHAFVLLAGDLALIALSLHLGALLRFGEFVNVLREYTGASTLFFLTFVALFYILELYDLRQSAQGWRTLLQICGASLLAMAALSIFFYWTTHYRYGRGIFLLAASLVPPLAHGWRQFNARYSAAFVPTIPTLMVGSGPAAERTRSLLENEYSQYRLAGRIRTDPDPTAGNPRDSRMAGEMDRLEELVRTLQIRCLIIAGDGGPLTAEQGSLLTRMKFNGVHVVEAGHFFSQISGAVAIESLSDSWLWFADGFELVRARMARRVKRLFDLLFASVGLLLSLPLGIVAAVAIKLDSPGPIFYCQQRVGLLENPFLLIKFRTMRADAESDGIAQWATVDDHRITPVGRWLRKLRIDEIPQMINVLKGEMSLIGPRPERPFFVKQLRDAIPFYHLRHYIRPGITGWAQVNYPYGASVEDATRKLEFDLYYIMNASLLLDFRILMRTVRVVLSPKGSR
jgi:sugar transferase (PEP-CTERM system associated)